MRADRLQRRLRLARPALHRRTARVDDRGGLAHPPRWRRAPRRLAARRHARPREPGEHGRGARQAQDRRARLHWRRRHGAQRRRHRAPRRREGRAGAQEHRQRSVAPAAARDARLRNRPPCRRRHREEPHGGRENDRPLVPRRDDGPAHRAFDAGHRQGGERDVHDHPRRVPRSG